MTRAQIQRIKEQLNRKWQDGTIHADEYFETAGLLDEDPDRGIQEAERILGKKLGAPARKTSAKGMSRAEFLQLLDNTQQLYDDGDVTRDELQAMLDELQKLNNHKVDRAAAEKVMQALQDGVPVEHAEKHAGIDLTDRAKKKKQEPKMPPGQDPGTMAADAAVSRIEKEIQDVYLRAAKEMQAKLNQVVKENRETLDQLYADKAAGKITQADIDRWVEAQNHRTKRMEEKLDQIAGVMTHANEKALGMINGATLGVFAENATFQSYQLAQKTGLDLTFSVYDENAVKRLIKEDPELLPRKVVNGRKDKAWNQRIISNALKQALIQGESIPALAKRIAADTASSNNDAMVRYARTAMTSAQNSGRQAMLNQAKEMGIKCKKVWLATLDGRTRDAHAKLDGQTADVDKPFKSDLGPIMYPGDMSSRGSVPANLYNCRCTLTYEYEGLPAAQGEDLRRDNETGELIRNTTYTEWKKQHAPDAKQAPAAKKEKKTGSKLQQKVEKAVDPVDVLSTGTRSALEDYTMGEEFHLDQGQFDEITAAMQETTRQMFRVETEGRTADGLQVGDVFDFSQQVFESKDQDAGALRSFTRSEKALPDLLDQTDDAVIFRTNGAVDQLPVDKLSQYDQRESLAYANGWKVSGFSEVEIDGRTYRVVDIEQIKDQVGQDGLISDYDTLMKKVNAMEPADSGYEEEKKNLLPMADKETRDAVHRMYMGMPESEREDRGKLTTLDISKLKTEQAEVFTDRLEDIAEQLGGRIVSGDPEKDARGDGITVALYKGEYIVLDGNNRTNLAILKGQETIDVVVVDLDAKMAEQETPAVVQGRDISGTWERRPEQFAFQINDVLDAQGFDGLPRIVDAEEFDRAVQESRFIAQRIYTAPDRETLDLYQQQLYEGEWYVDCGTGGAEHGQGMYTVANYDGKITEGMKLEMDSYRDIGISRNGTRLTAEERMEETERLVEHAGMRLTDKERTYMRALYDEDYDKQEEMEDLLGEDRIDEICERFYVRKEYAPSRVETLTMTPDAKIITLDELAPIYNEYIGKLDKELAELKEKRLRGDLTEEEYRKQTDETNARYQLRDFGVFAAAKGYDAINARAGATGSYTVILNRTKCIFKRDGR